MKIITFYQWKLYLKFEQNLFIFFFFADKDDVKWNFPDTWSCMGNFFPFAGKTFYWNSLL